MLGTSSATSSSAEFNRTHNKLCFEKMELNWKIQDYDKEAVRELLADVDSMVEKLTKKYYGDDDTRAE
jgi:hypothetical protein